MKLRMKLMLAPAVTGAMLALTLGTSIWVLNAYQQRSEAAHKQVLGAFAKVARCSRSSANCTRSCTAP